MPLTKLSTVIASNLDVGIGSVLGGLSSLSVASGLAPAPYEGAPPWLGYAVSLLVALAPMAIKAVRSYFKGEAAGDRVRAAKLRAKADKLRKAGDEAGAAKCEDQADELEAEAAEKEAKARGGTE